MLTTLASTTLGLTVAEVVARQTYGDGFATLVDLYEGHPFRPFTEYRTQFEGRVFTVRTNSLGWKDEEPRRIQRDPAPRKRVVFLGDSFTEGLWMPQEETLSAFAERRLNRSRDGFEVLNGGRVSYSPLIEYQRLKRFLRAGYRTDVLVLLPDISDIQDEIFYVNRFEFSPTGEPLYFSGLDYHPFLRLLYNHSALARSVRRLPLRLRGGLGLRASSQDRAPADLPPPGRAPVTGLDVLRPISVAHYRRLPEAAKTVLRANWMGHSASVAGWARAGLRLVGENILRIQRLAEEQEIRLLVAIYPWPQMLYIDDDPSYYADLSSNFGEWFRHRELVYGTEPAANPSIYERTLRQLCWRHAIELVDLFPAFQSLDGWHEYFLPGDVHFNARGHRLIGEAIAEAILAESSPNRSAPGRGAPDSSAGRLARPSRRLDWTSGTPDGSFAGSR